eukprot:CAMPEP_0114165704 /NCGR_PEP_ID=MMETSP0043_2-20121206/31409_1 /TAXON_ID=464988 /ORGANISM="Hemiselmis andersenii, Strain CCMP644" /LENGTH=51 /DNA_ID=CAMNT_0001262581 /DNA_START=45 /DNA_END=196 /DNA_ORIENTATION=-
MTSSSSSLVSSNTLLFLFTGPSCSSCSSSSSSSSSCSAGSVSHCICSSSPS